MLRAGGYAVMTDLGTGEQVERDSFTCRHCNRVTFVKPRQRPEDLGGFCRVCMGLVCSSCAGGACDVLELKLERMEQRAHTLKSYGIQG